MRSKRNVSLAVFAIAVFAIVTAVSAIILAPTAQAKPRPHGARQVQVKRAQVKRAQVKQAQVKQAQVKRAQATPRKAARPTPPIRKDAKAEPPPSAPSKPVDQPPAPLPSPLPSTATNDIVNNAKLGDNGVKDGVSPAVLRAQVMLDRLHASPGVIDGRDGSNFVHALLSFEKSRNLPPLRALNPKVWAALLGESGGPVLREYLLTQKDVDGPFFPDLPKDYAELARLSTIGYRSVSQKLGAEFHMGEDLLASLNPGVDLSKAGTRILVADVKSAPVRGHLSSVVVDKKTSQVLAFDRRGHILAAYPATIGSRELPSPTGSYRIRGVAWNPVYYYDPDKNFVQGDNKEKLKLPPGPNNPVGSVFIALSKPTYGLHGTPDPSKIDKTSSHGCVRMTNWDARELAQLVRPGVIVSFRR